MTLGFKLVSRKCVCLPGQGEDDELFVLQPSDLYEDVLMSTDQNMSWVEKVASGKSGNNISATPVAPATPPSMFLQTQPKPKNGITCYMAAFSDHN